MQHMEFKEGDNVVTQGEDADKALHLYVVERGELDAYRDYNDGAGPKKVFHYGPGGLFGELALMYNQPRAATVTCVTPCKLWALDRPTFRSVMKDSVLRKRNALQDVLAHVPLFANLDQYELLKVVDALKEEHFPVDTEIVKQGDHGDRFFILLEGRVKVIKDGVETPNSPLLPGQYFGELALLSDEARKATIVAIRPVKVAVMNREDFTLLLGPCQAILERNKDSYAAAAAAAAAHKPGQAESPAMPPPPLLRMASAIRRRGGISSEPLAPGTRPLVEPTKKSHDVYQQLERILGPNILFSALERDERISLYDMMQWKRFEAGDTVIRQGDTDADELYAVASGRLEVFKASEDGTGEHKVFDYGPGGVFGELALMYGTPRAATVKAVTPCKLWTLDRLTFRTMVLALTKRKRDLYQELLGSVPILGNLDSTERLKIADSLQTREFSDGTAIIREGEDAYSFYIILKGQVRVTVNGEETPNSPLDAGQYFGELALINNDKRAATITALGDVKVACLDTAAFNRLLGPCKDIMNRTQYPGRKLSMVSGIEVSTTVPTSRRRGAISSESAVVSASVVTGEDSLFSLSDPPQEVGSAGVLSADQLRYIETLFGNHVTFRHMDSEARQNLYRAMVNMRFKAGDYVIRQGDTEAHRMYIVESGVLEAIKDLDDGRGPTVVYRYEEGGMFGELALMYDMPRAASVRCVTDCKVWALGRKEFREILMRSTMDKREHFQSILAHIPILQNLDRYERLKLADCLLTETYADESVIVKEGEEGDRFYIILEGECKITKGGIETLNSPLRATQFFGELALLNNAPRKATVTCVGNVKLASIDREAFQMLMGPCKEIMERTQEEYK